MQTRGEIERSAATLPRESFGELLGQLANNSAGLVRDEIQLAKQEINEKITAFRSAVMIVIAAAFIGVLAALVLTAAAVIGLADYVGPVNASLIIGGALCIISSITAAIGLARIKRTSLKPEKTIETLEEDKEWLKDLI